jgi:hypothetical protein
MTLIEELDEKLVAEILATPVAVLEAELERANVRRDDPALLFPAAADHFGVKLVDRTQSVRSQLHGISCSTIESTRFG